MIEIFLRLKEIFFRKNLSTSLNLNLKKKFSLGGLLKFSPIFCKESKSKNKFILFGNENVFSI